MFFFSFFASGERASTCTVGVVSSVAFSRFEFLVIFKVYKGSNTIFIVEKLIRELGILSITSTLYTYDGCPGLGTVLTALSTSEVRLNVRSYVYMENILLDYCVSRLLSDDYPRY